MTTETEMAEIVTEALYETTDDITISTFEEEGLLTDDKGILVKLSNGSQFWVTISSLI